MSQHFPSPFNSPLETGVRALVILVQSYPKSIDLQRLVEFDYFVVHSGDVGIDAPSSLHAPVPYRTGELLVRRTVVMQGMMLFMSRGLIKQLPTESGIEYVADEPSAAFLDALSSIYVQKLRDRARWVVSSFGDSSVEQIRTVISKVLKEKTTISSSPDFVLGAN